MLKREKNYYERLIASFGKKPKNYNEDFDMTFVKDFYKARKEHEHQGESIDELTWNDLDMDSVFKRTNYTTTTLGEAYLYYKFREINYYKEEWENTEEFIETLMNNEKLRTEVHATLLQVGKLNDAKVFNLIYRTDLNRIIGYYKYPLLALCFILSIGLSFIYTNIGLPLTIFFLCTNILFYQRAKIYLEENFKAMIYLLNNVTLCQKLCTIKDKDFDIFKSKLKPILNNCGNLKKLRKYSLTLARPASIPFSDIEFILEYIKMFFMVDIISYQNIIKILEENKENFHAIYDLVAKLDFALSIAYFRASIGEYVIPEFTKDNNILMENVYHPLVEKPVKNSITIKNNIIFTGSNASGKSTFIKAIALNCIFAQSLNTALCSKYKCEFSKVITSMAIRDDVLSGDSYFVSELKSLKRLLDSLDGNIRVLAFIDEILKGTNTIERIAASASILKYGQNTKAKILVATHDIELTQMLEASYDNYHFRETVTDEGVLFDYKLQEGPSTTRNAIMLLNAMDFEPELVDLANELCGSFIKNKSWTKL